MTVVNVNEVEKKGIKLDDFDAFVLGSATYHGEMLQAMKTFLFVLEKANVEGKVGGTFRSFRMEWRSSGSNFQYHEKRVQHENGEGTFALKVGGSGGWHNNGPGLWQGDRQGTCLRREACRQFVRRHNKGSGKR